MSISSINYGASLLGLSVQNINKQLTDLSTQLSTGVKSPDYAGMGTNEGLAIAARSQLSDISAFSSTITNVTTVINAANTALQSLHDAQVQLQSGAASSSQDLSAAGQTSTARSSATATKTSIARRRRSPNGCPARRSSGTSWTVRSTL